MCLAPARALAASQFQKEHRAESAPSHRRCRRYLLRRPGHRTSTAGSLTGSNQNARGFTYSGQLRAFDFIRQNEKQNASNPNRQAFLPGGTLHAEYALPDTGWRIATSYTAADPFDANGPKPQLNAKVDNTLPGFSLSTFDEAYLAYTNTIVNFTAGDRFYNFIWMPSSDTRIKPVSYEGVDLNLKPVKFLEVGVSRIIRFEDRSASAFSANTLLTGDVPGGSAPPIVRNTAGALHLHAYGTMANATVRAESYSFFDLANLQYLDAKVQLAPGSDLHPFVAAQYVDEHQAGRALLGRIANNTLGVQTGISASKELSFTAGFDTSPAHYADVLASSATAAARGIFQNSGGTGTTELLRAGSYRVAYGGIASPYSDSYTGDPLYTTSISQGMVDRRSPGTAEKVTAIYLSPNRRFKGILTAAFYNYNNLVARNLTFQNDTDVQYFLNPVPAHGPYHGLSLRERIAHRSQPTIPYDFKYVRTQLEYDF